MQTTSNILMIRPVEFGFNAQTAVNNAFLKPGSDFDVQEKALKEFDEFVEVLRLNGVEVLVIDDNSKHHTPDSIFPNNWISTHDDGQLFIYPMEAENRRLEKRDDIVSTLKEKYQIINIIDLSYFENENKFLESTGSMVLDRVNKIAYACLSDRTNKDVLLTFSQLIGYKVITFNAVDKNGTAIYHTNVMMSLGSQFVVICLESIKDDSQKNEVVKSLEKTGKNIVEISYRQMNEFAGNMLQLKNKSQELILVMSERAYNSLLQEQIFQLERYSKLVFSPLNTIEGTGGGSARCMIAEIHLPEFSAMPS